MNINRLLKYFLGVSLFLIVCACQHDTVYYTYNPVPVDGWKRGDTLQFCLPDTLSPGTYNLEVGVRHSDNYPYRDLWLELTQYIPCTESTDSWITKRDTIHLYLANEKGNWNGTGTTGGHFQLISPVGSLTLHNDSLHHITETSTLIPDDKEMKVPREKSQEIPKKYTFLGKRHKLGRDAKHHLDMVQIMTDSVLLHISDIGLRLTHSHSIHTQE